MLAQKPFGRTDLKVSRLVLGGGFVGGILLQEDDEMRRALMRRLREVGINWIDTAALYGAGKSEEALGWLLAELPEEDRPILSSKFSIDPQSAASIANQIEASLDASLTRLGMDRLALFQLHNPVGPDHLPLELVLGSNGVLDTLDRLKDRGRIGEYGFTALGDPGACRAIVDTGRVASAQVYYNLLNPSAGHPVPENWPFGDFSGLLDACAATGTAVMNIRIFAAGALAGTRIHGREIPLTPNAAAEAEYARAALLFDRLGDRYGTRAQTAIRFSLGDDRVTCIVLGLAGLDHLEEALGAIEAGPLPREGLDAAAGLWNSGFGELT